MFCSACGTQNADQSTYCSHCGRRLQDQTADAPSPSFAGSTAAPFTVAGAAPSALEVFIPYKNSAAVTAYYLGIFSLVCGLFLGIPALILGIRGLRYANQHREARGKAHAWTGIILGSLTTLVSLGVVVAILVATTRK
jgi:hypothetical protein